MPTDDRITEIHVDGADDNQLQRLLVRKTYLTKIRSRTQHVHDWAALASLLVVILVPIFLWNVRIESTYIAMLAVYAATPIALLPFTQGRLRTLDQDLQALEFEIDLLQFNVNPRETRAEKVLRINSLQLQRYYDLNLNQNVWVFSLGIFCIFLGLGVIGATLYLILNVAEGLDTKIITGVVGSIGSFLSSYVAAIYLKMHAAATSHLGSFHSRLVDTQELLLGNLLASRIEDDSKRWETLSKIALNMSKSRK
jgi:hypothetical protein